MNVSGYLRTTARGIRALGHSKYLNRVTWAVLIVGCLIRGIQYASNPSLWFDEAELARNILTRGANGLLEPLQGNQAAPWGFLLLVKGSVSWLGESEYALRLVPLIAGTAALLLFFRLAKEVLDRGSVPIAVTLFSMSPLLINYSVELKQYSTDLFSSIALLLLVLWWHREPRNPRAIMTLAVLGTLGIWLSHPSIFVLAGAALFSLALGVHKKEKGRIWAALSLGSLWVASFVVEFLVHLRPVTGNEYLVNYWRRSFMPLPPSSGSDLEWYLVTFAEVFTDPVGLVHGALGGFAFLAGCVAFRSRKPLLGLLLSPIPFALLASGLHRYPFSGRLLLFLVPILILFVAEGTLWIVVTLRRSSLFLAVVFPVLILLQPILNTLARIPAKAEEVRPVVEYVSAHRSPEDLIYAYWGAEPATWYYAERYGIPRDEVIRGAYARVGGETFWPEFIQDLDRFNVGDRVWLIFSHFRARRRADERALFLHWLDERGTRIAETTDVGASAHLYEFSSR